ncbi:MAG: TatD family nuclease-associated radical SAM protein [Elusimicrobiaceae bacterium]|nr:TatD family nuclease-associated radical SAM protein [Elusimicrobiaceae bacterium]
MTIVYQFKNSLYINLTNRCPNACIFCAKSKGKKMFHGYNLDLDGKEPTAEQVLTEIDKQISAGFTPKEIIFCGYGEPTMALPVLLEVAQKLKAKYSYPLRLNTLGLGSLVWGRDITKELAPYIDKINISLNATDNETWLKIVRPAPKYAEKSFAAMQDFVRNASKNIKEVAVSVVSNQGIDTQKAKELAEQLGAKFFVREYFDEE